MHRHNNRNIIKSSLIQFTGMLLPVAGNPTYTRNVKVCNDSISTHCMTLRFDSFHVYFINVYMLILGAGITCLV